MDELSASDIECIKNSITENKTLDFEALSEKSHDLAWQKAQIDDTMDLFAIAQVGGANDEMLKYIQTNTENQQFTF